MSHTSGGVTFGSQLVRHTGNKTISSLLGNCPSVSIIMGGVEVPCLLDSGSMVTTLSEGFFMQHFEPLGQEKLHECGWLQLRAANGLDIPYVGYLELDFVVLGKQICNKGVLIVKDLPGPPSNSRLPGLLGMDIIQECYQEVFSQYGNSLFDLPSVQAAPAWQNVLQFCQQAESRVPVLGPGERQARVGGGSAVCIPAASLRSVAVTCSLVIETNSMVLFEPLQEKNLLSAGLLSSVSLVPIVSGVAHVPIVNVGGQDAQVQPHAVIGTLCPVQAVDWPDGVVAGTIEESVRTQAVISSQVAGVDKVANAVHDLDLSQLSPTDQVQLRMLLQKYSSVFAAGEGDMGCTGLITHEIPLLDSVPICQRYRRIPLADYEMIKQHIHQLLQNQVIREQQPICFSYSDCEEKGWANPSVCGL